MLLFYSHKNAIVFRAHGKSSITVGLHFTVPPSLNRPTYLSSQRTVYNQALNMPVIYLAASELLHFTACLDI